MSKSKLLHFSLALLFAFTISAISACDRTEGDPEKVIKHVRVYDKTPTMDVDCLDTDEDSATVCDLTADDANNKVTSLVCSINPDTVCMDFDGVEFDPFEIEDLGLKTGGATLVDCDRVDIPAQGELAGGGVCVIIVDVEDNMGARGTGADVIFIEETNQLPVVTLTCPANTDELTGTTCTTTITDADTPEQDLWCELGAPSTTCAGLTISPDCSVITVPAQGEAVGPGECDVMINVWDSWDPAGEVSDLATIEIDEVNQAPYFTSDGDEPALDEETLFDYAPAFADDDLPVALTGDPGYVSCTGITNNTCGGWLVIDGCVASGTPSEADGPVACAYDITVTDGYGLTAIQTVDITVLEVNIAPTIVTDVVCPANVNEDTATTCTAPVGADVDLTPLPNTLTCSVNVATTCVGVTVSPDCSGVVDVPIQGEAAGPGACDVVIDVTDDGSPNLSVSSTLATITIDEVNVAPTITSVGSGTMDELTIFTYNPTFADTDLPVALPGDPGYVSCTGITNNTCGAWLVVTGCNATGTPLEADGPGACAYDITVTDGYLATDVETVNITINEVNVVPAPTTIRTQIDVNVGGPAYNVDFVLANDPDIPVTFTCAIGVTDTCYMAAAGPLPDLTLTQTADGCNITFTVPLVDAQPTCNFDVDVDDGTGPQTVNVAVNVWPAANIVFVATVAAGTGDGLSWVNACDLTTLNGIAKWGDTVLFHDGNYVAGGTTPVLTMEDGVDYFGGCDGTEVAAPCVLTTPSVLDGNNTAYNVVIGATDALLESFTIQDGNANTYPSYSGGGILIDSEIATEISDCVISSNYAYNDGGGIFAYDANGLVIVDSTIDDNYAWGSGGGIYSRYSYDSEISDSVIYSNVAYYGIGGGIGDTVSDTVITRCLIDSNEAYNHNGGGIEPQTSDMVVTDSIIVNNDSDGSGGGIRNFNSNLDIISCTFTYNYAYFDGGAFSAGGGGPDTTIRNSILWDDYSYYGYDEISGSYYGTIDVQNSDIEGGYAGAGNINNDPLFTAAPGNLTLQVGSPCIDTGMDVSFWSIIAYDLTARPQGAGYDMGAYEQ